MDQDTTDKARGCLERVADSLIDCLDQLPAHELPSLDQVVGLVRASAETSAIVRHRLLARDAVARLVYLFLGEQAPATLKDGLSSSKIAAIVIVPALMPIPTSLRKRSGV